MGNLCGKEEQPKQLDPAVNAQKPPAPSSALPESKATDNSEKQPAAPPQQQVPVPPLQPKPPASPKPPPPASPAKPTAEGPLAVSDSPAARRRSQEQHDNGVKHDEIELIKQKSTEPSPPAAAPQSPARAPVHSPKAPEPTMEPRSSPAQAAGAPAPATVPAQAPATASTQARPGSKLRTDVKLRDVYKLGKTLGTGGFSVVKLATDRVTGVEYACKIMALPPVGQEVGENENTREDIFKEIDLLCGMNHENVIFLKEYFEEGNKVYLITELLTGGELLEAVLKRGNYTEPEARLCFVQVLRGIEYLHSKNVVHRDLKLENLLLAKQDDISLVKIADFGLAKHAVNGMQTICGTPQYVAPEVIVGAKGHVYGPGVDMWSAGVVLYILLGGYPPFWSDSEPQLFDMIRKGKYSFADPVWNKVSESAKDLIRRLLVVDPTKRLSATEALQHQFILEGNFPAASTPKGPR